MTNNNLAYCLIEAAQRFGIVVILPLAMSNHQHTVLYDPGATSSRSWSASTACSPGAERAARLLGRTCGPRSRRRWCGSRAATTCSTSWCTATNPIAAGLVERSHQWPGVNGLPALLAGRAMVARRPEHFFRAGQRAA
ncbi:MAG: hypothetical protein HS111_20890 [Kofleriaceae bacterium]|nr:hypothetical protein [Kofleriaceae bacterium]